MRRLENNMSKEDFIDEYLTYLGGTYILALHCEGEEEEGEVCNSKQP